MDIIPSSGKYDSATRERVVHEYSIEGNISKVSRTLNIPRKSCEYIVKSDAGQELLAKIRHEQGDRFIATSTKIIDAATKRTLDTIEEADCRTAATVGAIYYDKLRLALNQPTSIRGDSSSIQSLAAEFRRIAQDNRNIQASVVSTQVPDKEE